MARSSLLLLLSALLKEGVAASPPLTFTSPLPAAHFTTPNVPLSFSLDPTFSLGPTTILCVDVIWDLGEQSFCKDQLEDWVLRGLDTGSYAVRAELHDLDRTLPGATEVDANGHFPKEAIKVVAKIMTHFTIDLPSTSLTPKLQITWPKDNEVVALDGTLASPVVEMSFVVMNAFDGEVCVSPLSQPETQPICAPGNSRRVTVPAHPAGSNSFEAYLVANNAKLTSEFTSTQVTFTTVSPTLTPATRVPNRVPVSLHPILSCLPFPPDLTMNIAVISARTVDRYLEALTMLKSMLMNFGRSGSKYKYLHLHLVVDVGGRSFFEEELMNSALSRVAVTFYDFEAVCGTPVERFLGEFGFDLSAHYSGKAGYCRLFLAEGEHSLAVDGRFIAVESDQLFFEDVAELYEEFEQMGTSIGAPEMYQSWEDGRPKRGGQERGEKKNPVVTAGGGGEWHGYGYIGGIMAFDVNKLREFDFWRVWREELKLFMQDQEENGGEKQWEPRLNDQDVFNAVLSRKPEMGGVFDCSWNLQYHAYMNAKRVCEEEGGGGVNCDKSEGLGLFVCRKRAKVAHFMAGSYKRGGGVYYSQFWQSYAGVDMELIAESINVDTEAML